MDKEYLLTLDGETVIYVCFEAIKGDIAWFVVKLLSAFEGEWHEIIRYDSGHNCPHKDILNINGEVIRKVWYDFLDNGQALTMAIAEIKDNHDVYKERYKKWLKG